jgi:hypothetical protein
VGRNDRHCDPRSYRLFQSRRKDGRHRLGGRSATAEVLHVAPSALAAVYTFLPDTFDADLDENVEGLNQSMADQLIQYRSAQHRRRRSSTQDLPWYENFGRLLLAWSRTRCRDEAALIDCIE